MAFLCFLEQVGLPNAIAVFSATYELIYSNGLIPLQIKLMRQWLNCDIQCSCIFIYCTCRLCEYHINIKTEIIKSLILRKPHESPWKTHIKSEVGWHWSSSYVIICHSHRSQSIQHQNVKAVTDSFFLHVNPVTLHLPELPFWEYLSESISMPQHYPAIYLFWI
jgi:hypothetical protein